jgi:hypothetical protein
MKSIQQELARIKQALIKLNRGASLEEIKEAAGLELESRTLQRRLGKLLEDGIIQASGSTKGRLYYSGAQTAAQVPEDYAAKISPYLYLTDESQHLLSDVEPPIYMREPVGYNRDFLEQYRPNVDSYLTEEEKKMLAAIGKTSKPHEAAGTYAKEVLNRLLIDLSWNSSRLEGNTYSILDTERLIAFGETADHKSARDAQMILNHKDAIEFLVEGAADIGFNRYTLLNLHALLSHNLLPDPAASGRLRTFVVGIHKSVFVPLAVPQLIEEMFELMLLKAAQIEDPFEQSFFMMVHLPYLQPFDDVNKRVSRLAANISLNRHNLAPLSFVDMPIDLYTKGILAVYELNKVELLKEVFIWAYQRSAAKYAALRQSLGEPDPFRLRYRDALKELVSGIIMDALSRKAAQARIEQAAARIELTDQQRFIEAVETELLSLHEGNFARYRVRPLEFKQWKEVWEKEQKSN